MDELPSDDSDADFDSYLTEEEEEKEEEEEEEEYSSTQK